MSKRKIYNVKFKTPILARSKKELEEILKQMVEEPRKHFEIEVNKK